MEGADTSTGSPPHCTLPARVNPGFNASYTFHSGDSSPIQRADGHQAGCNWIMAVMGFCKENTLESPGVGTIIQGVISRKGLETIFP